LAGMQDRLLVEPEKRRISVAGQVRSAATLGLAGAIFAGLLTVQGCSSDRPVDVVQPVDHRPAQTDSYPDFARPLNAAMPQMTDAEAQRQQAQLSALAVQRQNGEITETDYLARVKELRLLIPKNTPE
jgi:hypothetical protein